MSAALIALNITVAGDFYPIYQTITAVACIIPAVMYINFF